MTRRHPTVVFFVILATLYGLYYFMTSFETGSTALARVQEYLPDKAAAEQAKAKLDADAAAEASELQSLNNEKNEEEAATSAAEAVSVEELASGAPIMAKMPNETIRAQVGNAGWKLLHTILAQYPETPTTEDQQTLGTYLKFFSRVYPCRECAEHFQQLLKDHPPQLSSRKTAVMWGCNAHNKVNKRLGKELFDCNYIFDKYDCGCGGDDHDKEAAARYAAEVGLGGDSHANDVKKTGLVPPVKGG